MLEGKIQGLDNALKNMEIMRTSAGLRAARLAGRRAINIVRDAAIANAMMVDDPESKEQIWKNISVKMDTRGLKRTGDLRFSVGVLGGAKKSENKNNPGGDTWYWRFLEFGVPSRGIAPKPFLLPALKDNIEKVESKFAFEFDREITLAAKRLKK
jgi:HK97 gp10 family phage protein